MLTSAVKSRSCLGPTPECRKKGVLQQGYLGSRVAHFSNRHPLNVSRALQNLLELGKCDTQACGFFLPC
jgi:hypothetical protein